LETTTGAEWSTLNSREVKRHGTRIEFDEECGASFARSD
jgi:hypothetical protein